MDDFVKMAVAEGGNDYTARQMWRSGCTDALVKKAKALGLTFKDLEEIYGLHGQGSMLVVNELLSRISR